MVEVRESNLFFSFLHFHKGLSYNTPYAIKIRKIEWIEDRFFAYWIELSDWEKYALLEMVEGGHLRPHAQPIYDNGGYGFSSDKAWSLFYRRYRKIKEPFLQQWMVDDLKHMLLYCGRWSWNLGMSDANRAYKSIVPTLYEQYFTLSTYEKVLKATMELQTQQIPKFGRRTVRKKGYRWDMYFPERIVRKYLNAITAVDNDERKAKGEDSIEVDWLDKDDYFSRDMVHVVYGPEDKNKRERRYGRRRYKRFTLRRR